MPSKTEHLHLKTTILSLVFVGFWPLQFTQKICNIAYKIYHIVTLGIYIVFVLGQYVELYTMEKDLEGITSFLAINLIYTLGLVKMYVVGSSRVKRLIDKIVATEKGIKQEGGYVFEIYKTHVNKNRTANKLMIALGAVCYLLFMLTPPIAELINPRETHYHTVNGTIVYNQRMLPLVCWFPFDRYKYYNWSFGWHALCGYYATAFIVAYDNMFFSLMSFAVGQIKILQYTVTNLPNNSVDDNLKKTIFYHSAIIRFVTGLNGSMRLFLLFDFAACALQIAVIGFDIAVAEISMQLIRNVVYIGSMVTQLFLFYWFGNELLLESAKVADSIWSSKWYEFNHKAKTTLLQMMIRSQKGLRISVGMFYYMSTATMVTILKTSYSYAAVMRQIYSRNQGT